MCTPWICLWCNGASGADGEEENPISGQTRGSVINTSNPRRIRVILGSKEVNAPVESSRNVEKQQIRAGQGIWSRKQKHEFRGRKVESGCGKTLVLKPRIIPIRGLLVRGNRAQGEGGAVRSVRRPVPDEDQHTRLVPHAVLHRPRAPGSENRGILVPGMPTELLVDRRMDEGCEGGRIGRGRRGSALRGYRAGRIPTVSTPPRDISGYISDRPGRRERHLAAAGQRSARGVQSAG